jgi:hypothetical protein
MKGLIATQSSAVCLWLAATVFAVTFVGCAARDDTQARDETAPVQLDSLQLGRDDSGTLEPGDAQEFDRIKIVRAEPQQISPGETVQLLIQVDRTAPVGEVRLTLRDLPEGVVVLDEQVLMRPEERVHRLTLHATPAAEGVVDAPVTIVATAEGHPEVVHIFRLTVTGNQPSSLPL